MTTKAMKLAGALLGLLLWGAAQAGTVTYVYTDPQGTPLMETDAQGNITARYEYTPYGVPVTSMGAAPDGVGYTGHVNDPETGLVYMQARYYDPMGRMLSVDPVGPEPGNVYSFNRYAYVNNNPLGYIDPDGRQAAQQDDRKPPEDQDSDPCDRQCRAQRQAEKERKYGQIWGASWSGNGNHRSVRLRATPNGAVFKSEATSGNRIVIDSTNGVVVEAAGVAGPLATAQFYFTVTRRPLDASGNIDGVNASMDWALPVSYFANFGFANRPTVYYFDAPSTFGSRWYISFPNQESTHDNTSFSYIRVYTYGM